MNKQEIFTKAYVGLRDQGFRQALSGDSCAYRGLHGRKCAIGHCIPDQLYCEDLEGFTPVSSPKRIGEALGLGSLNDEDAQWLNSLQNCHDNGYKPCDMKSNLQKFAARHDLEIPSWTRLSQRLSPRRQPTLPTKPASIPFSTSY